MEVTVGITLLAIPTLGLLGFPKVVLPFGVAARPEIMGVLITLNTHQIPMFMAQVAAGLSTELLAVGVILAPDTKAV
jgi:hypothetical protein